MVGPSQSLRARPSLRGLDLSSFLLIPMQRITRYPLLLKQILHYTDAGEDFDIIESVLFAPQQARPVFDTRSATGD